MKIILSALVIHYTKENIIINVLDTLHICSNSKRGLGHKNHIMIQICWQNIDIYNTIQLRITHNVIRLTFVSYFEKISFSVITCTLSTLQSYQDKETSFNFVVAPFKCVEAFYTTFKVLNIKDTRYFLCLFPALDQRKWKWNNDRTWLSSITL